MNWICEPSAAERGSRTGRLLVTAIPAAARYSRADPDVGDSATRSQGSLPWRRLPSDIAETVAKT